MTRARPSYRKHVPHDAWLMAEARAIKWRYLRSFDRGAWVDYWFRKSDGERCCIGLAKGTVH